MNNIIGTKHDFLEYEKLKSIIYQNIDLKNNSLNIYFSNCHSVCYGYLSKSFLNLVNQTSFNLVDGMPLVWSYKLKYNKKIKRMAGMDIFPKLILDIHSKKKKIYLLGGNKEIIEKIYKKLKIANSNTNNVKSFYNFKSLIKSNKEINNQIQSFKPDIIFVSLGCPKQEIWVANNLHKYKSTYVAVGGAFSTFAGIRKRPNILIQNLGLEWLYRSIQDPKLLFKRYLFYNMLFIMLFSIEYLKKKAGYEKE